MNELFEKIKKALEIFTSDISDEVLRALNNSKGYITLGTSIDKQRALFIYKQKFLSLNKNNYPLPKDKEKILSNISESKRNMILVITVVHEGGSYITFFSDNFDSLFGIVKFNSVNSEKIHNIVNDYKSRGYSNSYIPFENGRVSD